MTDLIGALEKALYARLLDQVPANMARVYQNVPENTPPPVVIIGDVDWTDEGGKDGPFLMVNVQIDSIVAANSRKPLNELQAAVHAALHRWQPTNTASVLFGEVAITGATGQAIVGESGMIYLGQQTAQVHVQPAD